MENNNKTYFYEFTKEENTYLINLILSLKQMEQKIPKKFKTDKTMILDKIHDKLIID